MGMGVTDSPVPVHWVPTPSVPLAWGALPINGMRWNGRDRKDAVAVWTQAGATTEDQNDEGPAMAGGSGVYDQVREREQQIDRVSEQQIDSSGEGGATTEGAPGGGAPTSGRKSGWGRARQAA